jgi:thioredoxin reductase (NADPH)
VREFDIVVAGGGIAGLSAGLTAARLGRSTLVLTGDVIGGQLLSIERIEGFPGFPDGVPGYDLCPIAQEQAADAGAEFVSEELAGLDAADGRWRLQTGEGVIMAGTVIVATGSSLKELGLPGEARLRGKGVSDCATCDGPLLRNRPVAVVGGGDSALQEALTLSPFASRVFILHRGESLQAQSCYQDRVANDLKIEVRYNTIVQDILGSEAVTGARISHAISGATEDLEIGGIFVYIGLQPNTALLQGRLALDPEGHVRTDSEMRTELAGLLAAGTVRAGSPCRAVGSAGEGATAAIAAHRYLTDGAWRS